MKDFNNRKQLLPLKYCYSERRKRVYVAAAIKIPAASDQTRHLWPPSCFLLRARACEKTWVQEKPSTNQTKVSFVSTSVISNFSVIPIRWRLTFDSERAFLRPLAEDLLVTGLPNPVGISVSFRGFFCCYWVAKPSRNLGFISWVFLFSVSEKVLPVTPLLSGGFVHRAFCAYFLRIERVVGNA